MSDDPRLSMKNKVEHLIYIAAGGRLSKDDLAHHDADLRQVGLDSLGYLNLLEGLERTFHVAIDLDEEEDHTFLHTIDNIVDYLQQRRAEAG